MRIVRMIKYPFLSGIFLPFKIFGRSGIKIRKGANIILRGRLTLGNSDSKRSIVSRLPINIYFGKQSHINIGHSVCIGQGVNIIIKDQATLSIGDNTYFTSDSHIEAVNNISIGRNCSISWGVTIIDDDHHQLIQETEREKTLKNLVKIGNKVWIGCNATILKNSVIGNNCVVAAGSIVKGNFPANSLIAGNPAKVVKQNIDWK